MLEEKGEKGGKNGKRTWKKSGGGGWTSQRGKRERRRQVSKISWGFAREKKTVKGGRGRGSFTFSLGYDDDLREDNQIADVRDK